MTSALEGIRVLDLTRVVAGPWATMMLGDMGAEVVKVENPKDGDYTRRWGAALPHGERPYFMAANRNKKSIAIDFSNLTGQKLVRELVLQSDVFVENYLTGTMEKYGLGWETLRELNPSLVYCAISGYGRTGPMKDRPGFDPIVQGESGLMSVTGEVDGRPMKIGVPLVDIMAGMYAAYAVTAALMARTRSGRGQFVDIALMDVALGNLGSVGANALLLDQVPGRYATGHADVVPFEMYPTSDGYLNLAVGNDAQFMRLCRNVLEKPELATSPRFATNDVRRAHRVELDSTLAACFRERPRDEWLAKLGKEGIPAGGVRDAREALSSPEAVQRGMVSDVDHPTEGRLRLVSSPLKLSDTPVVAPVAPPTMGQHTEEVLRARLGLTGAEVEHLKASGIVA